MFIQERTCTKIVLVMISIIKVELAKFMIIGTGIDIVELSRVEKVSARQPKFITRILTNKEFTYYKSLNGKRAIEFLAGRFAAKEALAKAMGTGIGKQLSWLDIEILSNEKGKPIISISNTDHQVHLSISHSKDYAVAQVIIENKK